ncbi:unnamed protein product, partial [Ectocarpus sp. 12 AP-2014]
MEVCNTPSSRPHTSPPMVYDIIGRDYTLRKQKHCVAHYCVNQPYYSRPLQFCGCVKVILPTETGRTSQNKSRHRNIAIHANLNLNSARFVRQSTEPQVLIESTTTNMGKKGLQV